MIIASAIKLANGNVYRGSRHGDVIRFISDHLPGYQEDKSKEIEIALAAARATLTLIVTQPNKIQLKSGRRLCKKTISRINEALMPRKILKPVTGIQGFIDDKDNFLTREQAAKHALECGQVETGKAKVRHVFDGKTLYSEDLW